MTPPLEASMKKSQEYVTEIRHMILRLHDQLDVCDKLCISEYHKTYCGKPPLYQRFPNGKFGKRQNRRAWCCPPFIPQLERELADSENNSTTFVTHPAVPYPQQNEDIANEDSDATIIMSATKSGMSIHENEEITLPELTDDTHTAENVIHIVSQAVVSTEQLVRRSIRFSQSPPIVPPGHLTFDDDEDVLRTSTPMTCTSTTTTSNDDISHVNDNTPIAQHFDIITVPPQCHMVTRSNRSRQKKIRFDVDQSLSLSELRCQNITSVLKCSQFNQCGYVSIDDVNLCNVFILFRNILSVLLTRLLIILPDVQCN